MNQKNFHKTKIATSLSLALSVLTMSSVASQVNAAESKEEAAVEIITVTGMMSSIRESTRLKRDGSGVVDAISAEDIGKFPDTNLAESLQRITGVSIDRSNGEGSRVTVRGFGPQFNMVTLNGRIMASSELPLGGGQANSRAFDFQNLSSDAVSSVEVYKTGKASIATGGIGASINIKTAKPLDKPGFHGSIGGKALMDTSVRDGVRDFSDKITPELSGLISWTDEEEVFGASLTLSSSARDSSRTGAEVGSWNNGSYAGVLRSTPDTNITNEPELGQSFLRPSDIAYRLEDTQRDRTNAQLVLQFRPLDNVTATFDYTYSNLEVEQQISDLSGWYDKSVTDVVYSDEGATATPVLYVESSLAGAPRDVAVKQKNRNYQTENDAIGLNISWDVNDNFNLTLDYADSESESSPLHVFGNDLTVGIGSNIQKTTGARYTESGLPVFLLGFDDCDTRIETINGTTGLNCNGTLDHSELGTSFMQNEWNYNLAEIEQIRLNGSYEFDEGSINFGIESTEMSNHSIRATNGNQQMGGWSTSQAGELPAGFLDPIDFNDSLDDYALSDDAYVQGWRGDAIAIGEWAADKYTDINFARAPTDEINRLIEEDIISLFFEINLNGELGGMPYALTAGLRYESTDSLSTSASAIPTSVDWTENNDQRINFASGGVLPHSVGNSYDHLLPSFDFSLDVVEDIKARFSYSKTIARPQYSQLSSATTVTSGSGEPTILDSTAFAGGSTSNPSLIPLESDNLDLSVEWYFDDTSYASIGYFDKRVKNFISNTPVTENLFGLKDATGGPRAAQALIDLAAIGITNPTSTDLFSMVAANQVGEDFDSRTATEWELTVDIAPQADDPDLLFRYQAPTNSDAAKVTGFEFAVQHFLGDTGFGFQANYTIVNGDVHFDNDAGPTVTQFALLGLSDTANLVLMYEKDAFSARIAYNWRDEFLENSAISASEPRYTEEYEQIDISANYQVAENLSVSFAGINITGEDQRQHGRTQAAFLTGYESDARYEIGARYTF